MTKIGDQIRKSVRQQIQMKIKYTQHILDCTKIEGWFDTPVCSVNDVLLSTWAVSVPPEQKSPFCRYRRDNFYQSKPNGRNSANEGKRIERVRRGVNYLLPPAYSPPKAAMSQGRGRYFRLSNLKVKEFPSMLTFLIILVCMWLIRIRKGDAFIVSLLDLHLP